MLKARDLIDLFKRENQGLTTTVYPHMSRCAGTDLGSEKMGYFPKIVGYIWINAQCVHWRVGFSCSQKSPVVAMGEWSCYRGITIATGNNRGTLGNIL